MKVIIFGASGMVGQGVLRECLQANDVENILSISRSPLLTSPQLKQRIVEDLATFDVPPAELTGYDACFFCLGVSAAGMTEAQYSHFTYDLTMNIANRLAELNPNMSFIYVSGAGTDSTEQGKIMWARIKGKTENALQRLAFANVWLFRPAIIQPLQGIKSKTASYRVFYLLTKPFLPVARLLFPHAIVTTEEIGKAMLNAVRLGYPKAILEKDDIARLGRKS